MGFFHFTTWVQNPPRCYDRLHFSLYKLRKGDAASVLDFCGGGEYKNVKEAAKAIVRVKETVLPDANTVALYAQRYVCFKKLYPALKSVFR